MQAERGAQTLAIQSLNGQQTHASGAVMIFLSWPNVICMQVYDWLQQRRLQNVYGLTAQGMEAGPTGRLIVQGAMEH